jgi:hypothetical protein
MDFTNILEYKLWSDRRILDAVAELDQEEQNRAGFCTAAVEPHGARGGVVPGPVAWHGRSA